MITPKRAARVDPRVQIALLAVILIALLVAAYLNFQSQREKGPTPTPQPRTEVSPNLVLGNPSNATADLSNRDNYLMIKPFFVVSYNNSKAIPNWVSWTVTQADLGNAPRKPVFDADDTLPKGFTVVFHKDYSGSGFDRGHLCPHGDRSSSEEMSFATFVLTNIVPQAPNVNRKAWEQLETYSRGLVERQHDRLYIVAGPSGQGGVGSNGPASTIAHGKIAVPARCWKIIIATPDPGSDDLSKITASSRVIAVDMPNDNTAVGEEWKPFLTSPARIEAETGYRFFTNLRPDIADALRQKRE